MADENLGTPQGLRNARIEHRAQQVLAHMPDRATQRAAAHLLDQIIDDAYVMGAENFRDTLNNLLTAPIQQGPRPIAREVGRD